MNSSASASSQPKPPAKHLAESGNIPKRLLQVMTRYVRELLQVGIRQGEFVGVARQLPMYRFSI
jgi:hypothetical protein